MRSASTSTPRFPARTQRPRPPSSRASSCSTRGCASRWRPTRRATSWASPIPSPAYIRKLAAPDYWPDIPTFIDDYLAANPTRNRDLDLLPLLLHFDADRVRAVLPNEKINGRPTFHYRLPDARVSDPGWSIAPDWNRWVAVERLAADRERLDAVGLSYLAFEGAEKSWADVVERIALAASLSSASPPRAGADGGAT